MPAPERFEAGTQPVSQAVALAEAVRYLERIGMRRVQAHEEHLAQRMLTGLATVPGVTVRISVGAACHGADAIHL
jgi:cysteine desulfurase/selenocysteine lyase